VFVPFWVLWCAALETAFYKFKSDRHELKLDRQLGGRFMKISVLIARIAGSLHHIIKFPRCTL